MSAALDRIFRGNKAEEGEGGVSHEERESFVSLQTNPAREGVSFQTKPNPDPRDPLQGNGSNLFGIGLSGQTKSPSTAKSNQIPDSPESGGNGERIGLKNPPEGVDKPNQTISDFGVNPVAAADLGESGISFETGVPQCAQAGARAQVIEVNSTLSGTQEPEEGVSSGIGEAMDPVEGAEPLSSAMWSPLSPFGGDEPPEGGKDTAALDLNCVTP